MGRCLHEGVREGLPLDRQVDRERKRERVGELQDCTTVNYFSIFHIETVEQPSCMFHKSNMSVQTKWIYRYYHMIHKYYSSKDVECF